MEMKTQASVANSGATDTTGRGTSRTWSEWLWWRVKRMNMLIVPLIVLIVVMSILSDRFLTISNQTSMLRAASVYTIIGVGQAFVMTSRNIDLSVGSMLALIMGLVGTFLFAGGSVPLAIGYALAAGIFFGLINGLIVTWLRVPALLATLGTLTAYRGMINQYMYGTTVSRFPEPIVWLGQGQMLGIPVPVYFALGVAVIGALLYHYTRFGRYAVAIGGNEEAALLAGIKVRLWKIIFFAFQGACVGLGALIFLGRFDAAHPGVGTALELHVIAGVVLGGTILFGGKGTMWGVVLGMFIIEVIGNGLLLAGFGFFYQTVFLGVILVAAVALQMARYRKENALG